MNGNYHFSHGVICFLPVMIWMQFSGGFTTPVQKRAIPVPQIRGSNKDSNSGSTSDDSFVEFWQRTNRGLCPPGQLLQRNNTVCCFVTACQPGYEIKECSENGTEDLCVECSNGFLQNNNVSSLDMANAKCFKKVKDHESCPENTKPSSGFLVPHFPYPCECKFEVCREPDNVGDCELKNITCGPNHHRSRTTGTCEPCPWYTFKHKQGCEPCTINVTLLRNGPAEYLKPTMMTAITTTVNITTAGLDVSPGTRQTHDSSGSDKGNGTIHPVLAVSIPVGIISVAVVIVIIVYRTRNQRAATSSATSGETASLMDNSGLDTPTHIAGQTSGLIVNGYGDNQFIHPMDLQRESTGWPVLNGSVSNGHPVFTGNGHVETGFNLQRPRQPEFGREGLQHTASMGKDQASGNDLGHRAVDRAVNSRLDISRDVTAGSSNSIASPTNLNIITEEPKSCQQIKFESDKILNLSPGIASQKTETSGPVCETSSSCSPTTDCNNVFKQSARDSTSDEEDTRRRQGTERQHVPGKAIQGQNMIHVSVHGNTFNNCTIKIGPDGVKHSQNLHEAHQMGELEEYSGSFGGCLESCTTQKSIAMGNTDRETAPPRTDQDARSEKPVQKVLPFCRQPPTMQQSTRHDSACPARIEGNFGHDDRSHSSEVNSSYYIAHQSSQGDPRLIPDIANLEDFSNGPEYTQTIQAGTILAPNSTEESADSQSPGNVAVLNNRSARVQNVQSTPAVQAVRPVVNVARQHSVGNRQSPEGSSLAYSPTDEREDLNETERKYDAAEETSPKSARHEPDASLTEHDAKPDNLNHFTQDMVVLKEVDFPSHDSSTCLKQVDSNFKESSFEIDSEEVLEAKKLDEANNQSGVEEESFEIFSEDLIDAGSSAEKQCTTVNSDLSKTDNKDEDEERCESDVIESSKEGDSTVTTSNQDTEESFEISVSAIQKQFSRQERY